MASQLIIPRQLDANGDPVSGAKANVYETGTTTPVTVYTDTGLSVAHANPIVSDGSGYFAQAFYGGATALKVVVTDSADATIVTYDPVPLVSLSESAASDVTHAPSTGNTATDVQTAIDNLSDGTAEFQAFTSISGGVIGTADIVDDAVTDAKVLYPSGLVFIENQNFTGSSGNLDFTTLDWSKYSVIKIYMTMTSAVNTGVSFRVLGSTDGNATYTATAARRSFSDFGALSTDTDFHPVLSSGAPGSGEYHTCSAEIVLYEPDTNGNQIVTTKYYTVTSTAANLPSEITTFTHTKDDTALDGIRMTITAANATADAYGLRNS